MTQRLSAERVDVTLEDRATFGRDYAVFFKGALANLLSRFTNRELRVFACLSDFCAYGNHVEIKQAEIARLTGISRTHVSDCITALEAGGVIETIRRGYYRIHEDVMWRGYARDHRARRQARRALNNASGTNTAPEGGGQEQGINDAEI
jgi:CRP-like cAMP-binding protein